MKEFIGFIIYSIIGAVIFLFVYSVMFNQPNLIVEKIKDIDLSSFTNSPNLNIQNLGSSNSNPELNPKDLAIRSCKADFNKYSKIGEEKYTHVDFSLIASEMVFNEAEAQEFDDLYSGLGSGSLLGPSFQKVEYDYPIIALAGRMRISQGYTQSGSIPIIISCNGDGEMSESSKKVLTLSL